MTAWPMVRLREVLKLDINSVPVDPTNSYDMVGVYSFGRGLFAKQPVSGNNTTYRQFYRLRPGQIVMSQLFGWEGALAVCPPEFGGMFVSPQFPTFSADRDRLSADFLGWYMRRRAFWELLGSSAKGMGDRRRTLNPESLLGCELPLPPFDEQRRIVERIAQVSYRITGMEHLVAESDQLAHSLMPSFAKATFGNKHWPMISVEDLVGQTNLKNGISLKSDGMDSDIRCLRLSAMREGNIDGTDSKPVALAMEEALQYLVHSDDVFIVRGNGSKELVGQAGVAKDCPSGTIFPDLFIRVPLDSKRMIPAFFVAWWNSPTMRQCIEAAAKTTSGIWKINQGHVASFLVPVPPVSEQIEALQEIEKHCSRVNALHRLREASRLEMTAVLPSLLNQAFAGRL